MKKKIILLDLNYTLAYREDGIPSFYNDIDKETYRAELIAKLKPFSVALITFRPERYKGQTLKRIKKQLGYSPDLALFNEYPANIRAPEVKSRLLAQYVFPKYGKDPLGYFAIESNARTRAMYASYKIPALRFDSPLIDDMLEKFRKGENIQEGEKLLF